MLDTIPVTLCISTFVGLLSGLGIGGGSLLILWLTLVLDMDAGIVRSINLLFFIPAAVISCFFRWRQGSVQFRQILPPILSGCTAALLFSFLSATIKISLLKKLFGMLLIFTGLRELFQKQKRPSS